MSDSGLAADPDFQALLDQAGCRTDTVIYYRGRVLDTLNAYAAPARRQGMTVEFIQAYSHGKLTRYLLVFDPSLPPQMQKQVVTVTGAIDWQEALVRAGLLRAKRRHGGLIPPQRYIQCPDCYGGEDSAECANCDGKGLVPSPDDS